MSEIETLTARLAAVEAALKEHRECLSRLLQVPAIRLHFLGTGGFPAISLHIAPPTDENPRGGSQNVAHPYDEELRLGSKLAAIARRDR